MTFVSAGHIIMTPTQPVGSGQPQRVSNLGPPHQESRALSTELEDRVSGGGFIGFLVSLSNPTVDLNRLYDSPLVFLINSERERKRERERERERREREREREKRERERMTDR